MNDPLFCVSCPTCEHLLHFHDETQLGQIVPCPKCGSMVLVQRPEADGTDGSSENANSTTAGTGDSEAGVGSSVAGVGASATGASGSRTGASGSAAGDRTKAGTFARSASATSASLDSTNSQASVEKAQKQTGPKLPPIVRKPIPPQEPAMELGPGTLELPDDATLYAGFTAESSTLPNPSVPSNPATPPRVSSSKQPRSSSPSRPLQSSKQSIEAQLDAEREQATAGFPLPFGLGEEMTLPKMLALMGALALLVVVVVGVPLFFLLGGCSSQETDAPKRIALQVPTETEEPATAETTETGKNTSSKTTEQPGQASEQTTPNPKKAAKGTSQKAQPADEQNAPDEGAEIAALLEDTPDVGDTAGTSSGVTTKTGDSQAENAGATAETPVAEGTSEGLTAEGTAAEETTAVKEPTATNEGEDSLLQSDLGRELLGETETAATGDEAQNAQSPDEKPGDTADGTTGTSGTEASETPETTDKTPTKTSTTDADSDEAKATDGTDADSADDSEKAKHDEELEFTRKSRPSAFDFQNDDDVNDSDEVAPPEETKPAQEAPTAFDEESDAEEKAKKAGKDAAEDAGATDTDAGIEADGENEAPNTIVSVAARGTEYLDEATAEKLAVPLQSITIQDKPLSGVIRFVSQSTGVTIRANWDQLKKLGVSASVPVRLQLTEVTARDVLECVLAENGLGCMQNGSMLKIVGQDVTAVLRDAAEKKERATATRLDLSDLVRTISSDSGTTGDLIKLIKTFVHPGMWDDWGGPGKVTSKNPSKVQFRQYPSIMAEVEIFCDKLRHVRGIPKKHELRIDPPRGCQDGTALCDSMIETRWERTKKLRSQKVTCDFSDGVTLEKALQEIFQQVDARLILEPDALVCVSVASLTPDADMPDYSGKVAELPRSVLEMTITERFRNITMQEAVERVLKGFPPLICYAVAEDAFFLTTKASADRKLMVEFLPVGDVFPKPNDAAPFIEQMQSKLFPKSWAKNGGQGIVYYDTSSKTLIVLQNPTVLGMLERALDTYRAPKEKSTGKTKGKGKQK